MLIFLCLQCHLPTPPRLALETHSRLCPYHTFHSSSYYFSIYSVSPNQLVMVGFASSQRFLDDVPRDMELSMARAATY